MNFNTRRQESSWKRNGPRTDGPSNFGRELIIPNPKLKLLDQVREVMRLRHYSIRTEQCHCDWNPASPLRLRLCAFALRSLMNVSPVKNQDGSHPCPLHSHRSRATLG